MRPHSRFIALAGSALAAVQVFESSRAVIQNAVSPNI